MSKMFFRQIESQITDFIDKKDKKNILTLIGARQIGKTSILQQILKKRPHLYLNLETQASVTQAINDCQNFEDLSDYLKLKHNFDHQNQILVIDEAQESLGLGKFIRSMKEEWTNATVILTGSTITELYHKNIREPVGRVSYLDMYPLNFFEFLKACGQNEICDRLQNYSLGDVISPVMHDLFLNWFDQYLFVGGLPEVIESYINKQDYKNLRKNIYKAYERDFLRYYSLDDVNLFKRCLDTVSTHVGSPSKDSQVIRPNSAGYKKISGLFAKLEQWKIIIKIEQLGVKPEKNKFHSKRYLYDNGILRDLRFKGISEIGLKDLSSQVLRTPIGGLIENAICTSLKIQFKDDVFGIKMSSQSEIDFGIKYKGQMYPIECKASLRFKNNYISPIHNYFEKTQFRTKGFLLYGGLPETTKASDIYAIPYYLCDQLINLIKE